MNWKQSLQPVAKKRLAVRDKKKKYLKLIPNAWNLIKLRSKNNDKFKNLNDLLGTFKKIK